MPYAIQVDAAMQHGTLHFHGHVEGPEMLAALTAGHDHPAYQACVLHRWDLRDVTALDIGAETLPPLVHAVKQTMHADQAPLALLAGGRVSHTFAHMLRQLIRHYTARTVDVFLTDVALKRWLAEGTGHGA